MYLQRRLEEKGRNYDGMTRECDDINFHGNNFLAPAHALHFIPKDLRSREFLEKSGCAFRGIMPFSREILANGRIVFFPSFFSFFFLHSARGACVEKFC